MIGDDGRRVEPRRIRDRRRDVGQLEQAARRRLVRIEQRERLRQWRDDLEAGERDERQDGEVDAVEPPRADELDADGQDRHRREAREGRRQGGRGPADEGQLGRRPVRRTTEGEETFPMIGGPVHRDQVGDPADLVDEHGAQLGPARDERDRRSPRQAARGDRQHDPGQDQERDQGQPEERVEGAEQDAGEGGHEDRHDGRDDDPDVEVLERLDVGDDPGQQVAAPTGRQACRGERLDRGEEPDPQVGQDRERRAMGHVPLEVAEGGPADGQHPDRGDGQRDLGHVAHDRRLRDQVGRHRHQRHVRADRQEPERRADHDPAAMPGQQPEQSPERGHGPASGLASASVCRHVQQAPVCALAPGEIGRRAGLDDPAGIDDRDLVGDRGETQPMRHDQHGPRPGHASDRVADDRLAGGIEMRGGFVEDDQPGVGQDRPGDRDALPLPAAQPDPALADGLVVAVREGGDEVVRARLAGGGPHGAVGRAGPGQPDVVGDAAVEQVRKLRHPGDLRPPGAQVDRGEVRVADQDAARIGLDEPEQQARDRRLAGAADADQRGQAPGPDREVEGPDRRLDPARVRERDIPEGDRQAGWRAIRRNHRDADAGARDADARIRPDLDVVPRRQGLVEDGEGARGDGATRGPRVVARRELAQWQEELGHDDEHRQRPVEGDGTVHQAQADLDRDERDRDGAAPLEHERGLEGGPQDLHRRVAVLAADRPDRRRPARGSGRTS